MPVRSEPRPATPPEAPPLALHGGESVRKRPMPARLALGQGEVDEVMATIQYYRDSQQDLPYQGVVEQRLCEAFAEYMGGGYADAVATGTGAVYVALAALDLPKGSEVIISPVTASSPLSCIILQGFVPVVADSRPGSYNMGVERFLERVTPRTSAVLAVHLGGEPLEIDRLTAEASRRGIKVLEDCSQAPGAVWNGRRVGSYGEIAALSTMYRKNLISGSSGGLVFTRDLALFRRAQAHADHGKPVWRTELNLKDPRHALFPALNFNTDELSCAIALASLRRLQETIDKRLAFLEHFINELQANSRACRPSSFHRGFSPFFFPVIVETDKLTCSKVEFAQALAAEGINLDPQYGCVVRSWKWALPYLSDDFETTNALAMRDRSFNLFLNERYGDEEVRDIIAAIQKVERHFLKD
ncbi:MAG: DegT/DnrJ/EryC1/StrS family aminotransferase [Candidatus Omnitrophota bacterium]|nr:DegT/DnrJ/EryC1/StrS family aminotransferase [Candidatus Omnitrophota bacterium]